MSKCPKLWRKGNHRCLPESGQHHGSRSYITRMHYLEKTNTHNGTPAVQIIPGIPAILRRLGREWCVPGDLPAVVPMPWGGPGQTRERPTALEGLAVKVPSDAPRVNVTAIAKAIAPGS